MFISHGAEADCMFASTTSDGLCFPLSLLNIPPVLSSMLLHVCISHCSQKRKKRKEKKNEKQLEVENTFLFPLMVLRQAEVGQLYEPDVNQADT